jgi:hypothetical protein
MDNSGAATECAGDVPEWTQSYFRYNVISTTDTTWEYQIHGQDGSDAMFADWYTAGKWISDYNGVYSSGDASPTNSWFNGTGTHATCGGNDDALTHSNWSAITGAGYETNSVNADPDFDAISAPQNAAMAGWGYTGLMTSSGGGSSSGTVANPAEFLVYKKDTDELFLCELNPR